MPWLRSYTRYSKIPRNARAFAEKAGAAGSLMNLLVDVRLNHQPEVVSGFMAAESHRLLRAFFQNMRGKPVHGEVAEPG